MDSEAWGKTTEYDILTLCQFVSFVQKRVCSSFQFILSYDACCGSTTAIANRQQHAKLSVQATQAQSALLSYRDSL